MTLTYTVQGALDAETVGQLKDDFATLAAGGQDIRLDLSAVDFLDSSGVGAIVFLHKRLAGQGYGLELAGVEGQPLRLLDFLRVTSVVKTNPALAR